MNYVVDDEARLRKKVLESVRLRALTPERTLRMGFELMEFAHRLQEAASRARR